jgi:hypothetical protein
MTWTIRRGEAITVMADDVGGRADDVLEVRAHLRPGNRSTRMPDPAADAAAVFEITERASSGVDDPGGWTLFIGADACNDLDVGFYLFDLRLVFGPNQDGVTPLVPVEIVEPATVRDA